MRSNIVPVHRIAIIPALAALSMLAAIGSACGQTSYYVGEMKIDSGQHLIPVGPKSLNHPAADSYYFFFHTATKLTTVNHLATQGQNADVHRLLYLEEDQDRLERTVKTDEIIAGPFGAVVAEKTCFYNRAVENYPSSIRVLIQSLHPEIGREIPDVVPEAPRDVPPLTSISIVRFFRAGSQLIFGSANYEANGTIRSIHNGRIINGDLQPLSSIMSPLAPNFNEVRQSLGLPSQVDVESYLRLNRIPLPTTSNPQERAIVILVYGFGKLIRQDSLEAGVVTSSRYLRPVVTEEEQALGQECDDRLREQQSMGRPTVR